MVVGCALAAATPLLAVALEVETRTSGVSSLPLVVDPAPEFTHLWLEWHETFDGAPIAMTLSDGGRWRGDLLRPRGELSLGLGIGRFAAALAVGYSVVGLTLEADLVRGEGRKLGVSASALAVAGGGWDLALVPTWSWRVQAPPRWQATAFGAARVRWGQTLYDVQGWSADRASPFATALTRDVALAPMAGVSIARWIVELRLSAGWEVLLVDHVEWEVRPTHLHRGGGPFVVAALRLRVPRVP